MNKPLKYILTIIVFIFILPLLKNIYLSLNYEHGNVVLNRIEGRENDIVGQWKYEYDTYDHGIDANHKLTFNINHDSSGTLNYKFVGDKIFLGSVQKYSFWSMLPWDEKLVKNRNYTTKLSENVLECTSIEEGISDTLKYKVLFVNDSLYIKQENGFYGSDELWGIKFSRKIKIIDLVNPQYLIADWITLFRDLYVLIKNVI